MNRDRLRLVAEDIDLYHEDFAQNHIMHPCGVPACIAGFSAWRAQPWGEHLVPEDELEYCGYFASRELFEIGTRIPTMAKKYLELNKNEAHCLFYSDAHGWPEPYYSMFHQADANDRWKVARDLLLALADGEVELCRPC